ncbi:FeoA family protein [Niallia nealsonii]|uniref:Ferrous iron transport protein A n=1 Tax=Niallia nealsonii TaxID=115979 RepID=A0A2N0Z7C9_9BACI|nr:FeoA family protein [Niallia nealsonii]PKG25410.1 ferrous iron transport protein A [Niallia nealsonii]
MGKEKLRVGEKIKINSLAKVNELVRRRLLDFGITEGSVVLVENKMPFSGPYILEFKGTKIGLRRREALQMEVEIQ